MSFIVAFPFKPKSADELKQFLFKNLSTLQDEGGYEVSVEEISNELYNHIKNQNPNNQELVNKQLEGWLIVPYDDNQQKYDYKTALDQETVSPEEAHNIYDELEKPGKFIYVFIFDSSESVHQALVVNSVFKELEHRLVVNY